MRTLLLTFALLASTALHAQQWQVYTHSLGDQAQIVDGELRGREHGGKRAFYLELTRALLEQLGQAPRIHEVPLARGLLLVQSHPSTVLFNLSRNPDREALARWIGPTLQETDYLYELRERPSGIRRLSDARQLSVCVLNGSFHEDLLEKQGFTAVQRSNSYSGCFRMLGAGRVQLVASGDTDLLHKLASAELAPERVTVTAVALGRDKGYIALSRDTPDAEVRRWQVALQQLQQSGRYQQLYQRYVH